MDFAQFLKNSITKNRIQITQTHSFLFDNYKMESIQKSEVSVQKS